MPTILSSKPAFNSLFSYHLIGLISNKLVTLAPDYTGTKKTTWGARLHLQELRVQTKHRQIEPDIKNLPLQPIRYGSFRPVFHWIEKPCMLIGLCGLHSEVSFIANWPWRKPSEIGGCSIPCMLTGRGSELSYHIRASRRPLPGNRFHFQSFF